MHAIGPYYLQSQQVCSICLEDKCNIITRCGHLYHFECLNIWVTKVRKCPLCVSAEFNPIIHYCSQCSKSVRLANISYRSQASELNNEKQELCNGCRADHQRENCDVSLNIEIEVSDKNSKELE
jgi:hypothetical protein